MTDVLASFLLPSRGRVPRLVQSIDALRSHASAPACFEVLVRADDDDQPTVDFINNQGFVYPGGPTTVCLIGPKGRGYLDLHLMCNELATKARGEFIVLWNDDALMLTQGWDDVLRAHLSDSPKVYKCRSAGNRNKNIFPIVRRAVYEAMGRFSESALNDFYMMTVAQKSGMEVPIDLDVCHDHPAAGGTIHDQTFLDAVAACGVCKYDSRDPRILVCIDEDVAKVTTMLAATARSSD